MALKYHLWGHRQRSFGYEIRMDVTDTDSNNIDHHVFHYNSEPDKSALNSKIDYVEPDVSDWFTQSIKIGCLTCEKWLTLSLFFSLIQFHQLIILNDYRANSHKIFTTNRKMIVQEFLW